MKEGPIWSVGIFVYPEPADNSYGHLPSQHPFGIWLKEKGWSCTQVHTRTRGYVHGSVQTDSAVIQFHHDGDYKGENTGNRVEKIAVWSNVGGTIIRYPYRNKLRYIITKPFEVVVIDNVICEHQTPWFPKNTRYFIRGWDVRPIETKENT